MSLRKRLRRIGRQVKFRLGGTVEFQKQFRGRGLDSIRECFGGSLLEDELERRRGAACRLLEIGCGHGVVLLELAERFPQLALDGLNRWKSGAVSSDKSLAYIAKRYGLAAPGARGNAPRLHFHDAKKLRFDDATFDVIVSQVSLQHVERKDRAIEETWRVLKRGGVALLNVDSTRADAPDLLAGESPRFVIWDGDRRVSLAELAASLRARGFDVAHALVTFGKPGKEWTYSNLVLRKNTDAPLALRLALDKRSSFDLKLLKKKSDEVSKFFWGYRSVYVREDA